MRNRTTERTTPDKVRAIRTHYEPRISSSRESFDVVNWASERSQLLRFRVLADNVDLSEKTLLDVGCGLGDLWRYLKEHRIRCHYTGVDLLEKMITAASQRYPDARFEQGDVFKTPRFDLDSFDVVFCSGVFNLDLGNHNEFLALAIPRLLKLTHRHLVFNLLHKRCQFSDRKYAYSDPGQVRAILEPLDVQIRIIDDYLPNDFTVVCERNQGRW